MRRAQPCPERKSVRGHARRQDVRGDKVPACTLARDASRKKRREGRTAAQGEQSCARTRTERRRGETATTTTGSAGREWGRERGGCRADASKARTRRDASAWEQSGAGVSRALRQRPGRAAGGALDAPPLCPLHARPPPCLAHGRPDVRACAPRSPHHRTLSRCSSLASLRSLAAASRPPAPARPLCCLRRLRPGHARARTSACPQRQSAPSSSRRLCAARVAAAARIAR